MYIAPAAKFIAPLSRLLIDAFSIARGWGRGARQDGGGKEGRRSRMSRMERCTINKKGRGRRGSRDLIFIQVILMWVLKCGDIKGFAD